MLQPNSIERQRTYDSYREAFVSDCVQRFEAGALVASRECQALHDLADDITGGMMAWRAAFERLDASRRPGAGFDLVRAAAIVSECVFDELLTPKAWRLLMSALALAEDRA